MKKLFDKYAVIADVRLDDDGVIGIPVKYSVLFDSENQSKFFRKRIDADVIRAYKDALKYVTDRIRLYCESRGGAYLLAPSYASLPEIFLENLADMGVVK